MDQIEFYEDKNGTSEMMDFIKKLLEIGKKFVPLTCLLYSKELK